MSTVIYWFRNDLRLADNPALRHACQTASRLVPVYCHAPDQTTEWGFERVGPHRRQFLAGGLADLAAQLGARGSALVELHGDPVGSLAALAHQTGARQIVCEAIAAPEEAAEIAALHATGLDVDCHWQSTLLDPDSLPFTSERLPDVFTAFRQAVEKAGIAPRLPLPAPALVPPLPDGFAPAPVAPNTQPFPTTADPRSAFPFAGGASAAEAHLAQYLQRKLPHTYKATRNRLAGIDDSSKFSPWLASGALSARQIMARLKAFEAEHGANEGSYWLWFELLWRDYFRLLHRKYGRRLYRASGLNGHHAPAHNPDVFARWRTGQTGEALVDAGMRELAATGYLSNRMRQIVASYLIHECACDWRAGAAWFEAQLIDYDVCSNHANWLYIAGHGTDPRGGRRFNPDKQTREHDADGRYRALWSRP